jgi:hypothetical protein
MKLARKWALLCGLVGALALAGLGGSVARAAEADPMAPALADLPLQDRVTQYDITWKFDKKVPVGKFITGDFYVVGPVTVVEVNPPFQNDRNGSMLNPSTGSEQGYGKVVGGFAATLVYNPKLVSKAPIAMKPGDSLVSNITYETGDGAARPSLEGYGTSGALAKTAAVLTCLAEPVPADTFRPSYCGHQAKLRHYGDLHTEVLLKIQPTASAPKMEKYERLLERPWIDHVYGWGTREIHPALNMPDYGESVGRVMGEAAMLLSCDYPLEKKKKVLIGVVQYGIDLQGAIEQGCKGWPQQGGFGAGRKWPILFAGVLLKDEAMQHPKAEFAEDQGQDFDHCWTGANVVFNGHSGKDAKSSNGDPERASYEFLHPSLWLTATSETYRRNSTAVAYPGMALAARLMHLEKTWDHDAFFAYVDRWMGENDEPILKEMVTAFKVRGWGSGLFSEGDVHEKFVKEMWTKYRYGEGMPPSGYRPIPPVAQGNVGISANRAFTVDGKPMLPLMLMFQGPDEIEWAKSVGINTFMGNGWKSKDGLGHIRSKEFLEKLSAAGMCGVFGPDARLCGEKNLLGWLQYDQPDAVKMQPVADITLDSAHQPDRTYQLSRLVDGVTANRQAMVSPMRGAEITIKLKEPVTASALAIWSEKGAPEVPKDIVFLLDGQEAAKGTLENKSGQQKFTLAAPATFKTLTVKVVSVYETDNKNKWGSMEEIQALDKDDKPLPLYTPTYVQAVVTEAVSDLYQWFKRMDSSRPVFVDFGAFAQKPPKGWEGDARKKLYGDLVKQCDAAGLEAAGIAEDGNVAVAVGDLWQLTSPGKPVFACLDLGAKGPGGLALAPKDLRARAWAAIIGGANALAYRLPGDKGSAAISDELKGELKRLNEQLTRLAPQILTVDEKGGVDLVIPGRWSGVRLAGTKDEPVILAQAPGGQAGGKGTIRLLGLTAGTKIEVVDENRKLMAEEGQFTDDFGPQQEHVYRIVGK